MVVAQMITSDSNERLRVGTQQHLPTFASKFVYEPSEVVLAARGLDTSGQKAQLVVRVLSALQGE